MAAALKKAGVGAEEAIALGDTPYDAHAAGICWSWGCLEVWQDPAGIGPDRVKFTVMRLRRKLGQYGASGPPIEAVRGFGYRYLPPR